MAICQIMIKDFMHGYDNLGKGYDQPDLETGIQYCEDLMEHQGLKNEPFHGYNLQKFIKWAKNQIEKLNAKCPSCGCRPLLHERHAFSCEWGE